MFDYPSIISFKAEQGQKKLSKKPHKYKNRREASCLLSGQRDEILIGINEIGCGAMQHSSPLLKITEGRYNLEIFVNIIKLKRPSIIMLNNKY